MLRRGGWPEGCRVGAFYYFFLKFFSSVPLVSSSSVRILAQIFESNYQNF